MNIFVSILLTLGAVVGMLGMVLLVAGACASAAIDHDTTRPSTRTAA